VVLPSYFDGGTVYPPKVTTPDPEEVNSAKVTVMARRIPGLMAMVTCPTCPSAAGASMILRYLVIHLNDHHHWSRERIADYLDGLEASGLDLTVHNEPVEERLRTNLVPNPAYATLAAVAPPSWFGAKLAQLKAEYVAEGEEKQVINLTLSDDQSEVHIETTTASAGVIQFSMDIDMVSDDFKQMLYGTYKEEQ